MSFHDHRTPRIAAVLPAARQQLGPVTLALRAMRAAYALPMEAPKRQIGPVTEAIRTMRAAVPDFDARPDLIALRRALANRIEADIAALDILGGDPDAEPSLGAPEPFTAGPALDWVYGNGDDREMDAGDDREEENEHGADEDAGEAEDTEFARQPVFMVGGGYSVDSFGGRR